MYFDKKKFSYIYTCTRICVRESSYLHITKWSKGSFLTFVHNIGYGFEISEKHTSGS